MISIVLGLIISFCIIFQSYAAAILSSNLPPKLLIISIDGFRSDYLTRFSDLKLVNLERFYFNGSSAPYMLSVFPTKTFPNHQTIATGLYPESHGIVDNKFYDPKLNDTFEATSNGKHDQWSDSKWFSTGAEPIWITNDKCSALKECGFQFKNRISGIYHWPSSNSSYRGFSPNPDYFVPYEERINITDTISRVLSWFLHPSKPVNLALIYYHPIDMVGHQHGTNNSNLYKELRILDFGVGYLLDRMNSNSFLRDNLNVIIISDHGMQDLEYMQEHKGIVFFNKILNDSLYTTNDDVNFWIEPKPGSSMRT